MIKLIGWITVIGLGLYTGIIQFALSAIGFAFLAAGGALLHLVGA
jgi:hypothetical protein